MNYGYSLKLPKLKLRMQKLRIPKLLIPILFDPNHSLLKPILLNVKILKNKYIQFIANYIFTHFFSQIYFIFLFDFFTAALKKILY